MMSRETRRLVNNFTYDSYPYLCLSRYLAVNPLYGRNIMEIKINPEKKKIVIKYDITEESKKILSQAQSLAESLPEYLVKILPFSKSKKDKGSQS